MIPIAVSTITMSHFTRYRRQQVDLPATGIVMITGDVGSGKSSIVEAVSHALWGKALREELCWQEGKEADVDVVMPSMRVKRTNGKKKGLEYVVPGAQAPEHATLTKGQADLATYIGLWDVWRRINVFSAVDETSFVRAKDKERKTLLEQVLSLGHFDNALKLAKADYATTQMELNTAQASLTLAENGVNAANKRLSDATTGLSNIEESHEDLDALRDQLAQMKARLQATQEETRNMEGELRGLGEDVVRAQTEANAAQRRLDLLIGGQCPTCEQPIPDELIASLKDDIATKQAEAARHAAADRVEQADLVDDVNANKTAEAELTGQISELVGKGKSVRAAQVQINHWKSVLDTVESEIAEHRANIDQLTTRVSEATVTLAEIGVAVDVLGLRGVRGQILEGSLTTIQQQANAWLSRLAGPGYEMQLSSTRDLKSGAVRDEISLEVREPTRPTWHRFKSTSGGERTFWDVAMMLGLGAIVRAAGQIDDSDTLFFDEIFKALDDDKKERAIDVLQELAETRCVVVITHDHHIKQKLKPDVHLSVADGVITKEAA